MTEKHVGKPTEGTGCLPEARARIHCWRPISSARSRSFPCLGSLPYRGFYDSCILLEGSAFRQIRGTQRKLLPAFVDFEMLSPQNNPYATMAYSGPLPRSYPNFTESTAWKRRGRKCKGKEEREVGSGHDQIFFRQCMSFRKKSHVHPQNSMRYFKQKNV